MCRYDVMYVTRSVRQNEKRKKIKNMISRERGEKRIFWPGATESEVEFSTRLKRPMGERSRALLSGRPSQKRRPFLFQGVECPNRDANATLEVRGFACDGRDRIERVSVYITGW